MGYSGVLTKLRIRLLIAVINNDSSLIWLLNNEVYMLARSIEK